MELLNISLLVLIFARRVTLAKSKLQFSRSVKNASLRTLYNLSLDDCRTACTARPACVSIDYNRMYKSCDLNKMANGTLTDGLLEKRQSVVHWKKSEWTHDVPDSCRCTDGQTCNFTSGSCVVEECNRLSPPPKSNVVHVGAKSDVSIRCLMGRQGFYNFGAGLEPDTISSTLTCTSDGTWKLTPPPGIECHVIAFVMVSGSQQDPYVEWMHGRSSRYEPGPTWNQPYRGEVIDLWQYLPITHVRLSVFKDNTEVKYVVFNAAGATSTNWFSQSRVISSSWQDLSTTPANYFTMDGHVRDGAIKPIRRFFMNVSYGGCNIDVGWFSVVVVNDVCRWAVASDDSYPLFLYSRLDTAGVWSSDTERADYVYVALCIGTC